MSPSLEMPSLRSTKVSVHYFLYQFDSFADKVSVYGMGVDLATVLAIMGTVWTGDALSLDPSFSIGGVDPGVNNILDNLGGILGQYIPY